MTHDDLKASLPAFALGALDRDEQVVVARHVETCAECQAELATLQRVVDGIGLEAAPVTPPAALRGRVLDRVARDPGTALILEGRQPTMARPVSRPVWLMPLAMAASLVLAAAALFYAFTVRGELAALRRVNAVMQSPDVIRVDLKGQAVAAGATGRAFWSRTQGLVFSAAQLPALPASRVYQLWTITGTAASSAGLLATDGRGGASLAIALPPDAPRPDALGVTIEPAGGSPSPTLPIVMLGATGQ